MFLSSFLSFIRKGLNGYQNLDIHMPSLNYQTLFGTQNIWADLEYKGTNSEGQHIWGLKGFGVNQ